MRRRAAVPSHRPGMKTLLLRIYTTTSGGGGGGGLAGFVPYVQIPGFNLGGQGKEDWLSTVSVVVAAVFSFRG